MKLFWQIHLACRAKHYSLRTEQAYARWIERFLRFHHDKAGRWTHPKEMDAANVDSCLTCVQLGVERNLRKRKMLETVLNPGSSAHHKTPKIKVCPLPPRDPYHLEISG